MTLISYISVPYTSSDGSIKYAKIDIDDLAAVKKDEDTTLSSQTLFERSFANMMKVRNMFR